MPSRHKSYAAQAEADAERERDTYYLVSFRRKGLGYETPAKDRYFPSVKVTGNPEKHPFYLTEAIEQFQNREKVADWREVAEDYQIDSVYYP